MKQQIEALLRQWKAAFDQLTVDFRAVDKAKSLVRLAHKRAMDQACWEILAEQNRLMSCREQLSKTLADIMDADNKALYSLPPLPARSGANEAVRDHGVLYHADEIKGAVMDLNEAIYKYANYSELVPLIDKLRLLVIVKQP